MAFSDSLLKILVCPESHQPLKLARTDVLARLNQMVDEGRLRDRSGTPVKQHLEGGLVREDGTILYVVRNDIPIMLTDAAIPLQQ